jgi:hypothetical protein
MVKKKAVYHPPTQHAFPNKALHEKLTEERQDLNHQPEPDLDLHRHSKRELSYTSSAKMIKSHSATKSSHSNSTEEKPHSHATDFVPTDSLAAPIFDDRVCKGKSLPSGLMTMI